MDKEMMPQMKTQLKSSKPYWAKKDGKFVRVVPEQTKMFDMGASVTRSKKNSVRRNRTKKNQALKLSISESTDDYKRKYTGYPRHR